MSENWEVYFGYIEDRLASVLLDMDIWQEIDTEKFRHASCLRVKLKNPNEDGFPMDAEAERLNNMEDDIIECLAGKNFIHVGRVTTDGARDIIFYSSQKEMDDLIDATERFMKPAGYEFDIFEIEEDETWEFYFEFLYPDLYQQQHMGNRQVIDALVESGDSLTTPRKVEHWLYFENSKMMKRFAKAVKKEGFSIEQETKDMNEDGKYEITISREDRVDFDSINEVTDLLVEISERYEGEYDGWETFVVKA
ncbi:DUF695 domain-containing protein [Siminovitchia sp. 179-K 8D1 HS]|uniref:DUF695 domain-containing protein n=1 Tax=Siminovitchia sp. 179-K 8D1 HS TaxID=3142385 RepID=UPI0039A30F20